MTAISVMEGGDWEEVVRIYREGIATGNATFEANAPDRWEDWVCHKKRECCLVMREEEMVIGWAGLTPASPRKVYAGVAEVSIYLAAAVRGRGYGRVLLQELIRRSEAAGIWMLQAAIFPENTASIRLHERCGFRVVGRRERLARMEYGPYQGTWRDIMLLERRSCIVGLV